MRRAELDFEDFFDVRQTTDDAQAAQMTLSPGQSTGGPDNSHADSDQWCYVVSGSGRATVDGEDVRFETGDLLVIEAGETHEIENDGDEPLETLNVYVPPIY
ncbi:cupin domain-containing protein [Halosimplex pelagicum]|uniref:Cupin domain-containing protein n=1 Tax=Halosimplex pelagicum TaxID=869886 RepID=A0A7D5T2U1_9EURY|nr:cupin domain-containing protein [Halosimplex pelagicum]QLH81451.1 cupin domain-containing protein [Halosimplex pelagicum]